jgi:hypothetical protein
MTHVPPAGRPFPLRKRLLLVVLAGLLLYFVLPRIFHAREPVYQGVTFTEWVKRAASGGPAGRTAQAALKSMGGEVVPGEIRLLGHNQGAWDRAYLDFYPRLPTWVQRRLPPPGAGLRVRTAAYSALQNNAHTHEHLAEVAALLKMRDPAVRFMAVNLLSLVATRSDTNCIGPLAAALDDPMDGVRLSATQSLGKFGPAAESAVPSLRLALEDRAAYVRICAADALSVVDTNAIPAAVALLEREMTNSDRMVRVEAARLTLTRPELGVKNGVRALLVEASRPAAERTARRTGAVLPADLEWKLLIGAAGTNAVVRAELGRLAEQDPDEAVRNAARSVATSSTLLQP